MKQFHVKIQYSHESYGGFDHKDGIEGFLVKARDEKSARKKALAEADKKNPSYEKKIILVETL